MVFIETLCEPIDNLLGGGVESGILTQIYGVAGSGKTSIALQCALNCISQGWKVVYIDADSSFPRKRFLQISSRFKSPVLSRFLLLSPRSFTDQSDNIDLIEILAKEGVHLIVFDSVASLYRYSVGVDREENVYINMELCRQMAVLLHVAERSDAAAIVLNQVRGGALQYSHVDSVPVASQVVDPWCRVSLRLERLGELPRRKAILEKHHSRPVGSSVEFSLTDLGAS
nr:ATPase domain-containing protein [Candidatus Njordarchaeota archaeon]